MNRVLKVVMHTNYKFCLKGTPYVSQLYLMYQYNCCSIPPAVL